MRVVGVELVEEKDRKFTQSPCKVINWSKTGIENWVYTFVFTTITRNKNFAQLKISDAFKFRTILILVFNILVLFRFVTKTMKQSLYLDIFSVYKKDSYYISTNYISYFLDFCLLYRLDQTRSKYKAEC